MTVVILGFKGSGKTTIGKALAQALSLPFYDTDDLLAKKFKQISSREVFKLLGEEQFRIEEQKILLSYPFSRPCIVSTGGGIVEHPNCKEALMQFEHRIFLDVPFHQLETQIKHNKTYLLIDEIKDRFEKRYPLYCEYSTFHLQVTHLSISLITKQLVEEMKRHGQ